jgi:hypothetical protein
MPAIQNEQVHSDLHKIYVRDKLSSVILRYLSFEWCVVSG